MGNANCCQPDFAGGKKLGVPKDARFWTREHREKAAKALFYRFDADDSGKVDGQELGELFRECQFEVADFGHYTDEKRIDSLVDEALRGNKNKALDLHEFLPVFEDMFAKLREEGYAKKYQVLADLYHDPETQLSHVPDTHMLIVSLDYKYNKPLELTGVVDGQRMERLGRKCKNVRDIVCMFDSHSALNDPMFPHAKNIAREIRKMGKSMQPGDLFFFFYSGHGINVPDLDGDEADGEDEAFATPDFEGDLTEADVLVDDDFARYLHRFIPTGCKILVITDCCHSGSICDVDSFAFRHEIIAIGASQDDETSLDMSSLGQKGGILTTALQEAVTEVQDARHVSMHQIYNLCVAKTAAIASKLHHCQSMNIQSANCDPTSFPWPLVPFRRP